MSTRNIASVFPDRPRYVLIDTSANNIMVVPGNDGFFYDLEHGHSYLVPEVRATTTLSSPGRGVSEAALAAAEKAAAAAAALNTPPSVKVQPDTATAAASTSTTGAGSAPKGTLKGFKFKEAKEKMLRKKKESDKPASEKAANRKSSGVITANSSGGSSLPADPAQRRRSSSRITDKFSWKDPKDGGTDSDDDVSAVTRTPVLSVAKVTEVSIVVVKDCMAMGPLSPDVREGSVYQVVGVDVDGNAEVLIRDQKHLIRLEYVQLVPMDNATREQKQLMADITQRMKDKKSMGSGGSFRRSSTAQRSMLTQIRNRMGRNEDSSSVSTSPQTGGLSTSGGGMSGHLPGVESSDEPVDEKLDPSSVYGKPLALNELPIPGPVRKCVEFFRRENHIKYEGIFRVPGSSNAVMRIRNKFLVAGRTDYVIPDDENPTVVASALKTFLFELPEPLIPRDHWYSLLEITDDRDFELGDAHALLDKLPEENVEVLRYLFDFLAEVAEHHDDNKMSPANLGMVFGIVLIQPPDQNVSNVGSSMPKEICTFFVEHVDEIFDMESESE